MKSGEGSEGEVHQSVTAGAEQNQSVWALMHPVRTRMYLVYACSALSTIASLGTVLILAFLILDLEENAATQINYWVVSIIVCVVLSFGLRLASFYLSHLAAFRLENILRKSLSTHFARLSNATIRKLGTGAMSKVLVDDIRDLHAFVADTTPMFPRVIIAPLLTLGFLVWLDWRLALVVIAVLVAVILYLRRVAINNKQATHVYGEAREEVNASIVEFIQAMPVVRTFDGGHATFSRYQNALDRFSAFVARWYRNVASFGNVLMVLLNPLFTLTFLLWAGAMFYEAGTLALWRWMGFLLMSAILAETILPLLFMQSTLQKIAEPVARIHAFRNLPPTEEVSAEKARKPDGYDVEFDRVSYAYTGAAEAALEQVSFSVPQGTVTALVGPSGAGKSTLAAMLPRFQDPDQGAIRIGGVDIRDMALDDLSQIVGFVFQENFLFSGSIADNIRLGSPDASVHDVERAARIAQAHDFIVQLPQGYDTLAGERGVFLSGGQRQRITIARAVLLDRPVLVLDEATAYADPENEVAITKALFALMQSRTVIVVAHRLSLIRDANQIVVLEKGRLRECGTHDSLLIQKGLYHRMWKQRMSARNWSIHHSFIGNSDLERKV